MKIPTQTSRLCSMLTRTALLGLLLILAGSLANHADAQPNSAAAVSVGTLQIAAGAPSTYAPAGWEGLLQRLIDWWRGAEPSKNADHGLANGGVTSSPNPDQGDASASDPLDPEPDPPVEPEEERGSVIDPNGTTPQ